MPSGPGQGRPGPGALLRGARSLRLASRMTPLPRGQQESWVEGVTSQTAGLRSSLGRPCFWDPQAANQESETTLTLALAN